MEKKKFSLFSFLWLVPLIVGIIIGFSGISKLKEAGKIRMEGKEYVAKDGDIFFFRFNV